MKREYPSTPEEAFEASIEGAYYAEQMAQAELQGRVGPFKALPELPVNTAWDLGVGDATAIWFWQKLQGQDLVGGIFRGFRRRLAVLHRHAGAVSPPARLDIRSAHISAGRQSERMGLAAEPALRN